MIVVDWKNRVKQQYPYTGTDLWGCVIAWLVSVLLHAVHVSLRLTIPSKIECKTKLPFLHTTGYWSVCGCVMCVIARAPPRTRATQTGRVYQKHGSCPVAQGPQCPPTQSGRDALSSVWPERRSQLRKTTGAPRSRHRNGRRNRDQRVD